MTAPREDVIARIRALRARAADAASSEAEAEAAARIAAKIIAENEITEAELVDRDTSGVDERRHNQGRRTEHPALKYCACNIGRLTECRSLIRGGENIWIGQPEDVEFAIYLCELIQAASERAYARWWPRSYHRAPGAAVRHDFLGAFGSAVGGRLAEMAAERWFARQRQTGTGLVVVKQALIDGYVAQTYGEVAKQRSSKMRREINFLAALAGTVEGQSLALSRPIETDDAAAHAVSGGRQ